MNITGVLHVIRSACLGYDASPFTILSAIFVLIADTLSLISLQLFGLRRPQPGDPLNQKAEAISLSNHYYWLTKDKGK